VMADRNFERALRSAARRGRAAGVCPDAATLAAYVDRSLSAEERAAIEAHVSDCMPCAEHLALVAALDASEESTVPTPSFDVGALIRRWGWLVPAMTGVLVVAVWLRTPDERPPVASQPTANRMAEEARAEAESGAASPDRDESLSGANTPQAKGDGVGVGARKRADTLSRGASPASSMADAARPASPPPAREAEAGAPMQLADRNIADEKTKEAQTQDLAAAAPAAATAASPASPADTREGALAKVAPAPMAGGGSVAGRMRKTARQESASASGTVLVRTAFGRIDRSIDGGQSWTNELGALTDRILVSLCPTATACWLGADNGAVFVRGTDGQWVRRVVPAPASAVQQIVALDNQHATVELSDGRRYLTANGGLTWTVSLAQR
jgi:Putative zinc-finger